ncbi:MAG: sugar-binding domain-containing protein [Eubacterium sp.]
MKEKEFIRLITIAQMYYEQNMTQADIAKVMNISRPSVSNLLNKARNEGIVKIEIQSFDNTSIGKSHELCHKFGLKTCQVITGTEDKNETQDRLYQAAVDFLLEILPKTRIMGLGWGYNISRVIDILMERELDNVYSGKVCPLIGTATVPHKGYHPNELATDFSRKTGFETDFLISPAFPTTKQEHDLFKTTDNYNNILAHWKKTDTALITLGSYPCVPDHATAFRFGRNLIEKKAVGNLLSYFFNLEGEQIKGEDDFAIQIPLSYLGKIKNLIGIVPAEGNIYSISSCLNTGYIKHLIIDENTARNILKMKKS